MLVPGADWGNNSGWEYNVSLGQSPHSLHSTPNNNSHAVRGFFFFCAVHFFTKLQVLLMANSGLVGSLDSEHVQHMLWFHNM